MDVDDGPEALHCPPCTPAPSGGTTTTGQRKCTHGVACHFKLRCRYAHDDAENELFIEEQHLKRRLLEIQLKKEQAKLDFKKSKLASRTVLQPKAANIPEQQEDSKPPAAATTSTTTSKKKGKTKAERTANYERMKKNQAEHAQKKAAAAQDRAKPQVPQKEGKNHEETEEPSGDKAKVQTHKKINVSLSRDRNRKGIVWIQWIENQRIQMCSLQELYDAPHMSYLYEAVEEKLNELPQETTTFPVTEAQKEPKPIIVSSVSGGILTDSDDSY
jgi:hypothetical protein